MDEVTLKLEKPYAVWIRNHPDKFKDLLTFAVKFHTVEIIHAPILPPVLLPVTKGQIGENAIEDILSKHFNVKNVSDTSKSGDLSLFIDSFKILVEVKNYNNNIPTLTIDKFYRDLTTSNCDGAIFISLNSPITGITKDFSLKNIAAGDRCIPCIFIVSDQPAQILTTVGILRTAMDLRMRQPANTVADIALNISDSLDVISKIRDSVQLLSQDMTSKVIKCATDLGRVESNIRTNISKLKEETLSKGNYVDLLTRIPNYNKLDNLSKSLCDVVLFMVDVRFGAHMLWRGSLQGIEHTSGIKMKFKKNIYVVLPVEKMTGHINELSPHILCGQAEIFKKNIEILLNQSTSNLIALMI